MEITSIQKKLILCISILTLIMASITFSLYRGLVINPNKLDIHYKTLKSEKIPESLNDISILYFTDLQYGAYQNKERCDRLFQQIQHLSPDVVIFGGDLIDQSRFANEETVTRLSKYLSKIDAPLGKFAILGEKDEQDETTYNTITNIYEKSEFEILKDTHIKISNQDGKSIRLIGLSLEPNYEQVFANINSKEYNILVSHYPDALASEQVATTSIDYGIAGHSHSTQVSLPIFGGYKQDKHTQILSRTKLNNLSFPYYLSSGTGCTHINMRLLSDPEMVYFILKHK